MPFPGSPLVEKPRLESTLTCPACGWQAAMTMPEDACTFFHPCAGCGVLLEPRHGDCCVFCSYGSVPCPPVQQQGRCCGSASGD
jgi:hypothetical protein